MKKSTKVWLGIATMWPILYMLLFFTAIVLLITLSPHDGGGPGSPNDSAWVPLGFMGLMAVHMITIFGSLALTVFYIIRVFKTESLDQNLKIMWTLLLFFFGMFAQPIFWYLYIWREAPVGHSPNQPPPLLAPGMQTGWGKQTTTPDREGAYVPPSQPPDWR